MSSCRICSEEYKSWFDDDYVCSNCRIMLELGEMQDPEGRLIYDPQPTNQEEKV